MFFGRAPDQRCTVPESAGVYWGCQARGCKCVVRWWSPCRRASQGDSYSCVWHNSVCDIIHSSTSWPMYWGRNARVQVYCAGVAALQTLHPRWCIFTCVTWLTHGVRDTYTDGARRGGASVLCHGGRPAHAPSKEIDFYHVWHVLFLEFVTLILRVLSVRVHMFCAMVVALQMRPQSDSYSDVWPNSFVTHRARSAGARVLCGWWSPKVREFVELRSVERHHVCLYICTYMYIYVYMYVYVYIRM